jgi:hypothetical protein
MYHVQHLGPVIRRLREMRLAGAGSFELMSHLRALFPDFRTLASKYMNRAFSEKGLKLELVLGFGKWNDHGPESEVWEMADRFIDQTKDYWSQSRFPELMRLRDYFSFLEFSAKHRAHVIVCDADYNAGPLIGRSGYRCFDGDDFVVSREQAPHVGCLAADPADARLVSALAAFSPFLSYPNYVDRLRRRAITVAGPEEGHVLRAPDGSLLYQGYRLHGVYSEGDFESMWTAASGEHLRAEFNRRLGHELVVHGPHDDWELRSALGIAGPRFGPQAPALEFQPEGSIRNFFSVDDMKFKSPVYQKNWSRLYPDESTMSPRS